MIIVKEDRVVNSDHVFYFGKETNRFDKFLIVFYFYQECTSFCYELEEDRDYDYRKIIEAYKTNEKLLEL